MKWWLTRFALPLLVTLVALGCAGGMVLLKGKAKRGNHQAHVEPVEVLTVHLESLRSTVHGTGEVVAARELALVPQVGGAISWLSPEAVPGGTLSAGQELARIDDRDYQLALRQAAASLQAAQLELELEQARQRTAQREWELLGQGSADEAPLALRRPHLQAAQLALEAAQAGVDRARLDLERTRLRVPFDAVVLTESLEIGQVVGTGSAVATLAGTEVAWVDVSLPADKLDLLDIPGRGASQGSEAVVLKEGTPRPGRLIRLQGQLDPQTRTARVLVEVPDPLSGAQPLLTGSWAEVDLYGPEVQGVATVPRAALVDTATLWLLDDEDTLRRRDIEVGWTDEAAAYAVSGLREGERVVVSPVSVPVQGTPARVLTEPAP